jgi:hypothetical protein
MSDTLAQLIVKLQTLLLGTATVFSTETCTAAFRQALGRMNLSVPAHAAELLDAVTGLYDYELTDADALAIVDVLLQGEDTYNQFNQSLLFDSYFEDDRPFFRLRFPQPDGKTLIARYTKPYIINGLDSETDSTLPALYDVVLLDGAAWQACLIRSAGRIEAINMNIDVPVNFEKMAAIFKQSFELGMANLATRHFPRSEPTKAGWNDEYQGMY